MKSVIGVYGSHEKALSALSELQKSGYPIRHLSIIGKADIKDRHIHVKEKDTVEKAILSIGTAGGAVLGILTSIGVFAIPGFGLLYGAGAFVGICAGLELGFMTGGIGVILTTIIGVDKSIAHRYEKYLNEDKFLVLAQGTEKQVDHAKQIMDMHGSSLEVTAN